VEMGNIRSLETGGETKPYDHIISSMPLPLLCKTVSQSLPAALELGKKLKIRSTILVYLLADISPPISYSWAYVYSKQFLVGRITNFGLWTQEDGSETVLAMEYWCDEGDALWTRSEPDLIQLAAKELTDCKISDSVKVKNGFVHRVKGTHPAFEIGYHDRMSGLQKQLTGISGLYLVGRHGRFDLSATGASMKMGIDAAESILKQA
jgi:protoporphyrinogen oxidase